LIERHPKLDPVATMTEGVFIAGVCQGPKDIPASVSQGAAAAARVLGLIGKRRVKLEPVRASVNQDQCSGCRICNNMCPFNAITFLTDRKVTEINPALCQGCGTCISACPAGAITGSHFSNVQVMAQIEGILLTALSSQRAAELVPA
jgi:heterodisulfide reductase subunit A